MDHTSLIHANSYMVQSMVFLQKSRKIQFITLGTKILFGVTVVTSILIGTLITINLRSIATIEKTVDQVLQTREQLSSNLRDTVVQLQNDFLELPEFFNFNPQQGIIDSITAGYDMISVRKLTERSEYKSYFSRGERRDISKGGFIVKEEKGRVFVSYGELDGNRSFNGTVVRMEVSTNTPKSTVEEIQQVIAAVKEQEEGEQALVKKVAMLGDMVAETGLQAEQTRMEILQHVENITAKEQMLNAIRRQQHDMTIFIGIGAIIANMLILFVLVRLVIERPLMRLTRAIGEIECGSTPEIPMQNRQDQIGVLSVTMEKFRQVLLEVGEENRRKIEEKKIIEDTVVTTQRMIESIESQARELAGLSEDLQGVAETTGTQASNVARSAEETAGHTRRVADSSVQLEGITHDIGSQVTGQKELVRKLVEKNMTSQQHMTELGKAVSDIDSIIALIGDITEQTQLLALNATIEAARAGEVGKGFSIVASEMKELSGKTQQAANDVLSKVDAINSAGETLTHTFADIAHALRELDTATAEISAGVSGQQRDVEIIRELAGRTSVNTTDVSSSILEVNEAAGKTSALSIRVHDFADQIALQLKELKAITTGLHALQGNGQQEGEEPTALRKPSLRLKADERRTNAYTPRLLPRQAA